MLAFHVSNIALYKPKQIYLAMWAVFCDLYEFNDLELKDLVRDHFVYYTWKIIKRRADSRFLRKSFAVVKNSIRFIVMRKVNEAEQTENEWLDSRFMVINGHGPGDF